VPRVDFSHSSDLCRSQGLYVTPEGSMPYLRVLCRTRGL